MQDKPVWPVGAEGDRHLPGHQSHTLPHLPMNEFGSRPFHSLALSGEHSPASVLMAASCDPGHGVQLSCPRTPDPQKLEGVKWAWSQATTFVMIYEHDPVAGKLLRSDGTHSFPGPPSACFSRSRVCDHSDRNPWGPHDPVPQRPSVCLDVVSALPPGYLTLGDFCHACPVLNRAPPTSPHRAGCLHPRQLKADSGHDPPLLSPARSFPRGQDACRT